MDQSSNTKTFPLELPPVITLRDGCMASKEQTLVKLFSSMRTFIFFKLELKTSI